MLTFLLVGVCLAQFPGGNFVLYKTGGEVESVGRNQNGQLGLGDTTDRNVLVQIAGLSSVVSCAGGGSHSLCVATDGTVWAFGNNVHGQLGLGFNCAEGCNELFTSATQSPLPVSNQDGSPLSNVVSCAAGFYHSLCILSTGEVKSFGENLKGQLGLGDTAAGFEDNPVTIPGLSSVQSCAAGEKSSVCILSSGEVVSFGRNNVGQLGQGDLVAINSPQTVPGLSNVRSCAGSYRHYICVSNSGTVTAVGNNDFGQLGLGDTSNRLSHVTIPGLSGVESCAVGDYHTLCVTTSGDVKSWGSNENGQLGMGDTVDRNSPVTIPSFMDVESCSAGSLFSLCTKTDSTVFGFGKNHYGQLGLGADLNDRLSPSYVTTLTGDPTDAPTASPTDAPAALSILSAAA
jgi:alpha-tubulin suppressor-like RCC1 family protein